MLTSMKVMRKMGSPFEALFKKLLQPFWGQLQNRTEPLKKKQLNINK